MPMIRSSHVRPVAEAFERRLLMAAASLVGSFTNQPAPPSSMADGEIATASYTVKNVGNASSSDFLPIFELEENTPTPGLGGDIGLAAVNSIGTSSTSTVLAAGKTATETLEFVLPQNVSGTCYIIGQFSVSNYFASAPIDVNGQTPSLAVNFIQASVPAAATFGSTLTPQLQIDNSGTADATGQEVTDYYLSTSNDPNQQLESSVSGVYFVGSSTESFDLAPTQNTVETPTLTLPNTATTPPGTYYLVAQANEGSPPITDPVANNPVAVSAAIALTPATSGATSTLALSLSRTKLPSSLLSDSATPTTATIEIQNEGSSSYSGTTHLNLYLSLSATLDSSAIPVSGLTRVLRISAHRSTLLSVRLGAVPAVANGDYDLLAQVIDSSSATNSVASATTVQIAAPFVALAASLPTPAANVLKTGMTLSIENSGNIADSTILDYTLGFSSDPQGNVTVGKSDQARTVGRLLIRPGKALKLHLSGWSTLLLGLSPGQYYLTAFVEDSSGNTSLAVTPTTVAVS
jgi:hypothetical protein